MAWGKVPGRDPGPILSPRDFLPTKYFVELFRLAAILSSRLVGGLTQETRVVLLEMLVSFLHK
jgi:hypothetical protein